MGPNEGWGTVSEHRLPRVWSRFFSPTSRTRPYTAHDVATAMTRQRELIAESVAAHGATAASRTGPRFDRVGVRQREQDAVLRDERRVRILDVRPSEGRIDQWASSQPPHAPLHAPRVGPGGDRLALGDEGLGLEGHTTAW